MSTQSNPGIWRVLLILLAAATLGTTNAQSQTRTAVDYPSSGDAWLRGQLNSSLSQGSGTVPQGRKPGVAFLLSAVLPGAGQLYNGNRRGYVYMGLEMGAWFVRSSFVDAGNRKEEDSEAFARRHWDYDRFSDANGQDGCQFGAEEDSLIVAYGSEDLDRFYSELDGNDIYACGWDDFAEHYDIENPSNFSTPRRSEYRDRIDKSNSLKGRADFALGLLFINRVVSAVDAFRVARGREEGNSPSLRLHSSIEGSWTEPRAVFRLTKELR